MGYDHDPVTHCGLRQRSTLGLIARTRAEGLRAAVAVEREREQATEAKRVAERMARDAEAERERQVTAA
ncbi:hypothetical protein ACIBQX_04240 [Nonomuraea sp. NPDC049714]|uniref:hypothetical protein n=1 Tax=Nonomuraea sp. NPDC049714 TaxID=3364357 RepID=UPI00379EDE5B